MHEALSKVVEGDGDLDGNVRVVVVTMAEQHDVVDVVEP